MNKKDLVVKIAKNNNCSQKLVNDILTDFCDDIMEAVSKREKVQIAGFGTFEISQRSEREGFNPRTKEKMVIPAMAYPKFKAGKCFKEKVSE